MHQGMTHMKVTGGRGPDPAKIMAMLAEMDPEKRDELEKLMTEKADG